MGALGIASREPCGEGKLCGTGKESRGRGQATFGGNQQKLIRFSLVFSARQCEA